MENASKALLMAAGVLIGVMLLSFMVMLFQIFGNFAKQEQEQISDKTTQQFNMQFLVYEGDNRNAYDVVNVIHLVQDIRNSNNSQEQGYNDNIRVIVEGSSINQDSTEKQLLEFLEVATYNSEGKSTQLYKCTIQYNDNARVDLIRFSR